MIFVLIIMLGRKLITQLSKIPTPKGNLPPHIHM